MRIILTILSLIFSASVFADASLPPQTVTHIGTGWSSNGIYFTFAEKNVVEGCSETDERVVVAIDHPMKDDILSIALSAYHAGKPVTFGISGCTSNNQMKGIAVTVGD